MKNQWNKKKRTKHLCSSKETRSNQDGVIARGKIIAEESELLSILELMLKDIVDQGGTISLNVEDGRLSISGRTSGMILCDDTWKEGEL